MRILHQVREVAKSCHVMLLIIHATFFNVLQKREDRFEKCVFRTSLTYFEEHTGDVRERTYRMCKYYLLELVDAEKFIKMSSLLEGRTIL